MLHDFNLIFVLCCTFVTNTSVFEEKKNKTLVFLLTLFEYVTRLLVSRKKLSCGH